MNTIIKPVERPVFVFILKRDNNDPTKILEAE